MTDRSKLKLHPGSRWEGDAVVDSLGFRVSIDKDEEDWTCLCAVNIVGDEALPWISDALAVIRDAGLDPEFKELEEAMEKIAKLERATAVPKCSTCPRFVPPDNPGDRHGWCKHPTLNLVTDVPPDGSGYCWRHPEARKQP